MSRAKLAQGIAEVLKIGLDIVQVIIEELNRLGSQKDTSQDSLVIAYATYLLNESRRYQNISAVALLRSGLNYEITGNLKYLDAVIIGTIGYDLYIINQGQIINRGERGFSNWTVIGNSTQNNNVITIP